MKRRMSGRLLLAWFAFALSAAGRADEPAPPPTAAVPPVEAAAEPAKRAGKYALDSDRFYFSRVEDDAPVRTEDQNPEEFAAYNDTLLHARQFPTAELEAAGRRDVSFLDLVKDIRRDYQFDLVTFEGRLVRLRSVEPNKPLAAAGVKSLYEGWVFPHDRYRSDPVCVVLTELPAGLTPTRPGANYAPMKNVAVAGYSFKLMRYESSEPDPKVPTHGRTRRAPLLLCHSLTVLPAPGPAGGGPWRTAFLPGVLGLIAVIVGAAAGMTWYFRRGDRAHRREADARRERNNPFGSGGGGTLV